MNVVTSLRATTLKTRSRPRATPRLAGRGGARVLLMGWGPHADRTYVPHIGDMRDAGEHVQLSVVCEIEAARAAVTGRMEKHAAIARPEELAFIAPSCPYSMDAKTEIDLNRMVQKHRINAVIVATPPEAHRQYVLWALRNGISVLVDKPVTSRADAVSDLRAARGIRDDVMDLIVGYDHARRHGRVCCIVNAQRRWHPAFRYMKTKIEEVRDLTGHPVSHIAAAHADGQFRLPAEWVDLGYHGYRHGNGKLSASGYHLMDMIFQLYAAGWTHTTRPTLARVQSSFVQPAALLRHLPREQYDALFGPAYEEYSRYTDDELRQIASRLGEIDASITVELMRDNAVEGQAIIDVQHNTVSGRSWLRPRENLYKGNGRMKREFWRVDSGPFQSIRLETIQAEDEQDRPGAKGTELGEPNHLQIVTVRNEMLLGAGPRREVVNSAELGDFDANRLHSEQVKMAALKELIDFVQGRIAHAELRSDLCDHRISASVMSAAYASHVLRQQRRGSGWVSVKL